MERIIKLNENATENTYPDLTFYFDICHNRASKRVDNRGSKNRLDKETEEFGKKVVEGYKKLIEKFKDRYRVIDASKTPDEVFNDLKTIFNKEVLGE